MAETVHAINYIVSDPDTLNGQPRIAGRRVAVAHVADSADEGLSAERIAEEFSLTLAEVHAALSYYHDHAEEIERQVRQSEERARKHFGSGRSKAEYLKKRG